MNRHDERDNLWGIDSNDRRWFQALTLAGGVIASIIMAFLELEYRASDATPNVVGRNILLSIGASFVAAGFVSWAILQAKELMMAIADWIREATERRRERLRDEGRSQGLIEGIRQGRIEGRDEGRIEGRGEGYDMGYDDRDQGKPRRRPPTNGVNPDGDSGASK